MIFKEGTGLYASEIEHKQGEDILYVNYMGAPFVPSVADDARVMMDTIGKLAENPTIARIVFVQQRNYHYPFEQAAMLGEIARIYNYLTKQEALLSPEKLSLFSGIPDVFGELGYFLSELKQDPIGCYLNLKRRIKELREQLEEGRLAESQRTSAINYARMLERFFALLESSKMMKSLGAEAFEYFAGDREIYKNIFRPDVMPNFTFTRLVAQLPEDAEMIDQYDLKTEGENITVTILKRENDPKYLYHIMPPEYTLSEEQHMLLNLARSVLSEHRPKGEEFTDPERTRQVFLNVARDLLSELSTAKGIGLNNKELMKLSRILVRYTVGFGLIEVLLLDNKLQDIMLNAPIAKNPVFVRHEKYDECVTNIIPSYEDADSWAAKLRLQSGRPLDEANPVLDTDLVFGNIRARVAAIKEPLSPSGLAYAFRRHRDMPWTLPLFIQRKMLNSFAAGLLSFVIDGSRTLLVAGTRSSGKCVDGNTLIQLSDGSVSKIKDLVGLEKKKIEDGVIFEPAFNAEVKSLENMKMSDKKISDVWRRESPEVIVKIKTRSGKEIITTKEHPYFIYSKGIKNKMADELKVGELIASPRKLEIEGNDILIDLRGKDYFEKEEKDFFVLRGKTNSLSVRFPKEVTPELAEFVGLIVGDGHIDLTKIEFHNSNDKLRGRYIELIKMFGVPYRVFKSHTTTVVQISSRALSRAISDIFEIPFGRKADKVIISRAILKSSKKVLAAFLRGYFDTDGYVSKRHREIELVSRSKIICEHLRLALLRFGITLFTKRKDVDGQAYYRNLIYGDSIKAFAENIGFYHPDKKMKLEKLVSQDFIDNTNVDVIPQGNEIVRKLRKMLRVSPKEVRASGKDYWAYENNEYRVTRKWFGRLVRFYRNRFNELSSFRNEVGVLREIGRTDWKSYLSKIGRIRKLLGLSYIAFAVDAGLSEGGIRKILNNQGAGSFENIIKIAGLISKIDKRMAELSSFEGADVSYNKLPEFVANGLVSYAEISRSSGIPETTLKYCCRSASISEEKKSVIEKNLALVKERALSNLREAYILMDEICSLREMSNYLNSGLLLSHLRNVLNISNGEFVSEKVCIGTVSNFFVGKYKYSIEVLSSLARKAVEIFDSAVCDEADKLLLDAKQLAESDIFWDEVSSVEIIDKIDDYVYDLTVDETHNFVANGLIAHNTSLLGALMLEIMPKYRVICVEDTLELSVDTMRNIGYDILRMKVRSALVATTTEIEASEGIRTSLRLGDSALIVGEVRSAEAKALYEAMRVGALANVVAGTIHGDSPYGVFDRVVNDLGVPVTSFKATDLILVANPVKTPDGLHSVRRVMSLTEVRKHWIKDPLEEGGFVDLLRYNVESDELEPTPELMNGDSDIIKRIAGSVKGWAGNWDLVFDNIILRGKMKQEIVDAAEKLEKPELMEAPFVVLANTAFHRISELVVAEGKEARSEIVFPIWKKWMYENAERF